jgi:hypothetical protein
VVIRIGSTDLMRNGSMMVFIGTLRGKEAGVAMGETEYVAVPTLRPY